jgi:diketogulonate reductase-like aldo/keto reductase
MNEVKDSNEILTSSSRMNYLKLNNGVEMPQVGLGTYMIPNQELEKTIATAIDLGYRKFDTALRYNNEREIVNALKKQGVNRNDVFITTKISIDAFFIGGYHWNKRINLWNFKTIKQVIQESFDNLDTDYIDLFLIHSSIPIPFAQKMYKGLTKFYKEGKIRAIGVCSCLPPHFCAFEEISDVIPAVHQFEISPLNTQKSLIKWCQKRDVVVEAMSTFSHFRSNEPRPEILENPVLIRIAQLHQKSVAQVVLRWLLQQGISIIPKTWNEKYLAENIDLFDFELSSDEMAMIDSLDRGRFLNYNPYIAFRKPYASWGRLPKKYRNWNGFENEPDKVFNKK